MSDTSASSLDRTCSASCTKAGITALLISVLALSLLPLLTQVRPLNALSAYVGARITLKTVVGELDGDRCWQALRSDSGIERSTLLQLKERPCFFGPSGELLAPVPAHRIKVQPAPSKKATPQAKSSDKPPTPAAPTGLMVGGPIGPLADIEEALSVLGQRETLKSATSIFQYRFGSSINRWERRAYQRLRENRCKAVPDSTSYHFHECLTVADVKFLADFEYLDPSAVEQVFREQTRISFPNAASPINLPAGTILVEFGLLISVIYFWLYQREACRSDMFPAPGTLFAVFSGARFSRELFVLFASIPAWSAVLLAFWSTESVRVLNRSLAVLVVVFCSLIVYQPAPNAAQSRSRRTGACTG